MSGSTNKKVLIRRFDRESLVGFVNPQTYLRAEGLELLRPDGTVVILPYTEIKTVYFVRDFDLAEEPPGPKLFNTRPKIGGLWVRMRFKDQETMEGVLLNDLLRLDPAGFILVPPDPSFSQQRVFVPRAALEEFQVLGVVGSPLTRRKPRPAPKEQIELFEK
ncbi:MAG: hypothetical protein IT158_26695 [Bryobacterales bacterium]|nr:hypothetical protein [Bryobacterales bacterium]